MFARFIYALVLDQNGVGMPQFRDVHHQMNKGISSKATYVVNSGAGLHLYYVPTEPASMYPRTSTI